MLTAAAAHHAAHASPATLILLALAGVAVWAGSRYAWPWMPCPKCKGTGLNRGSNGRRFGECPRCRGRRRVQRPGSRTVHRLAWTIRGETARAYQRRRDRRAERNAEHPRRLIDSED